jgi:osmotically-inducible protein OsmY
VHNRLEIRNDEPPDDADLARRVESALGADPYEHRHDFEVSADAGRVKVKGRVDSQFDVRRVRAVASGVAGVLDVEVELERLQPTQSVTDPEIETRIRDELFWDAWVDERHVQVEVQDGVAMLSGWVGDWNEWDRAEENALEGGAVRVVNQLSVEPARH